MPTQTSTRPVRQYEDGRSPSGWTGSLTALVGFIVATIGAMTGPNWPTCIVGAALVVLALVAAGILKALGYGQSHLSRPRADES